MRVFFLLNRCTTVLRGVEQLVRKAMRHRLLAALAGSVDDPAHGQRLAACGTNLDRDLVGCATDATRLHLDDGLDSEAGRYGGPATPRSLA